MRRADALKDFVAPWPLFAVLVMAVNDAFLKHALHSRLTGKLSDFAICFFLPLYVAALAGLLSPAHRLTRVLFGAAFTAVLFVAIKVSPEAAHGFTRALSFIGQPLGFHSFRAVADPTDLVALPFILLSLAHAGLRFGPDVPRKPLYLAP